MTDENPSFPLISTPPTPTGSPVVIARPLSAAAGGNRVRAVLQQIGRLPAQTLLALVWIYQRTLSPALPVLLGPSCGCRFSPTCSHYAAEAVRRHGALLGVLLSARRLLKCTPLHPGGFDPVPESLRPKPRCRRAQPGPDGAAAAAAVLGT